MTKRSQESNSLATLSGLAFLAVGVGFLLFLAWGRMALPGRAGNEEIENALADLVHALERDKMVAGEALLPAELSASEPAGIATLRNSAQFWEPVFREAERKMKRR